MARERRNPAAYWRRLHSAEVIVKCHCAIFTFHSNLGSPTCQPNSLTWTEAEVLFFWNTILWLCLYSLCLNYLFSNVFPQHTTQRETVKKTSQSTNKTVWSFIPQPLLVFKSFLFFLYHKLICIALKDSTLLKLKMPFALVYRACQQFLEK